MQKDACKNDELQVSIQTRSLRRFKAGSELSAKVNMVSIDVNEDQDETHEIKEIKIKLSTEVCAEVEASEELV